MTDRERALKALDRIDNNDFQYNGFERDIKTIRAALKTQWQPIETAPRDGTKLLLCVPGEEMDYKKGSKARVIGYYAKKYTLPMHDDVYDPEKYPDSFDYEEKSGEWYASEGFYTFTFENHYGDEIARSVHPTHWMPLPSPPDEGERR